MTVIEARALRIEGNVPVPCSSLQAEVLERKVGEKCERHADTINGLETLRLCAFAPPGSPIERRSVVILPWTVKDTGLADLATG